MLVRVCAGFVGLALAASAGASDLPEMFATVDRSFADYAIDSHIPGLVYGIVANGRLVYVHGLGGSGHRVDSPGDA